MSQSVELQIQQHLKQQGKADSLLESWLDSLEHIEYSDEALWCMGTYLLNSGYQKGLLQFLFKLSKLNLFVPWSLAIECFGQSKISMSQQAAEMLLEAHLSSISDRLFPLSHSLDSWSDKFSGAHASEQERWQKRLQGIKDELKETLEYVKAQRLKEEEVKILDKLRYLFPHDEVVRANQENFEERQARDIIDRGQRMSIDYLPAPPPLKPDELHYCQILTDVSLEIAKKKPAQAYNLSLMFFFMELYDSALSLISLAPAHLSTDWFRLELLIYARRFPEAMAEAGRLESKYAHDAETSVAVTYARARALWGLNKSDAAIEMMQKVVNTRPHYLSAKSLLKDWTGR